MRSSSLLSVAMVITVLLSVTGQVVSLLPDSVPILCPEDQVLYEGDGWRRWCGPKCTDGQVPNGAECVTLLPKNKPPVKDVPWYKWFLGRYT